MNSLPKVNTNPVHLTKSILELAKLIKEHPQLLEKKLVTRGNGILAIYQDTTFKNSFNNLRQLKIDTFTMIAEDLAMGAMTLKQSIVGLTFKENRIQTFICSYGANPAGNLMLSVSLRNIAAFMNWREGDADPLPEDDMQACLYLIAVQLSELIS